MIHLLNLFFPTVVLAISFFFLYRGINHLSYSCISGNITPEKNLLDYKGEPCIYSSLVIESFIGGHLQWKTIYGDDQRSKFILEKTLIDPTHSDIRLTPTKIISGYIKRDKGVLEKFFDFTESSASSKIIKDIISYTPAALIPDSEIPNKDAIIDEDTTKALYKNQKLKKIIAANVKKPLRITEYSLYSDSKIWACSTESGDTISPFLITNKGEEVAKTIAREKAYVTSFIGCGLLLLSFIAFFVILLS